MLLKQLRLGLSSPIDGMVDKGDDDWRTAILSICHVANANRSSAKICDVSPFEKR